MKKLTKIVVLLITFLAIMSVFDSAENIHSSSQNGYPKLIKVDYKTIDGNPYLYNIENEYEYYKPERTGYRYGPAITVNDDGTIDMGMSSPGNGSTEGDGIRYTKTQDRKDWDIEQIVLRPTPESKDKNSVCDPAVVYFNDFYYLAYTATDDTLQNGFNNKVFVARAKSPEGPYEKGNGGGWGGNPAPIIDFSGEQGDWGVGEPSLLVYSGKLHIYYSYSTKQKYEEHLALADLSENGPASINEYGTVLFKGTQDSLDVAYDEYLEEYIAVAIDNRMTENSKISVYTSKDGRDFKEVAKIDCEENSHNIGISKNKVGHINSKNCFILGYAYGPQGGTWSMNLASVELS